MASNELIVIEQFVPHTVGAMNAVTVDELFDEGDDVIHRVMRGETFVVIRDGHEVAELRPLQPRPVDAATLLSRWSALPHVDPARLRQDIGAVLDVSP